MGLSTTIGEMARAVGPWAWPLGVATVEALRLCGRAALGAAPALAARDPRHGALVSGPRHAARGWATLLLLLCAQAAALADLGLAPAGMGTALRGTALGLVAWYAGLRGTAICACYGDEGHVPGAPPGWGALLAALALPALAAAAMLWPPAHLLVAAVQREGWAFIAGGD